MSRIRSEISPTFETEWHLFLKAKQQCKMDQMAYIFLTSTKGTQVSYHWSKALKKLQIAFWTLVIHSLFLAFNSISQQRQI